VWLALAFGRAPDDAARHSFGQEGRASLPLLTDHESEQRSRRASVID